MIRVGLGYDLHRLVEGRRLILGGVIFDFEKGEYALFEMSFTRKNGKTEGTIEKTDGEKFESEYKHKCEK